MNKVKIKFLEDFEEMKQGKIYSCSEKYAKEWVNQGYAEYIEEENLKPLAKEKQSEAGKLKQKSAKAVHTKKEKKIKSQNIIKPNRESLELIYKKHQDKIDLIDKELQEVITHYVLNPFPYKEIRHNLDCVDDVVVLENLNYDKNKEKIESNQEGIYSKKETEEALEKFRDKKLLKHIHEELKKTHLGDDNLKMTTFLTCVSGLSKNPRKRMSIAIKSDASEGKDNNTETSLLHMPNRSYFFLTNGTQATIEDDIKDVPILAFSEINKNREAGANKFITEVLKQKSEGGTHSIKKDQREGRKGEARVEKGEQATILYGTTETETDEELQTRFIEGFIQSNYKKIKSVNHKTLDTFSDKELLLNDAFKKDSWIKIGLTHFWKNKNIDEVLIPYAKFLKEEIEGEDIFDHKSPRSQRDLKRVLSLTSAMTFLFQEQREVIEYNGKKILISEPQDFINTLKISSIFFNQSYSGLDARLNNVLKIMKELGTGWIARDDIQEKLGKSRNTIKDWCNTLAGEGCLKGIKGKELNELEGTNIYNGNKIYYERCQKGVKKPLIRCQVEKLKVFLQEKTEKLIDTFDYFDNSDDKTLNNDEKRYQNKGVNLGVNSIDSDKTPSIIEENDKKTPISEEIDTFLLTPLDNFNPKEVFK